MSAGLEGKHVLGRSFSLPVGHGNEAVARDPESAAPMLAIHEDSQGPPASARDHSFSASSECKEERPPRAEEVSPDVEEREASETDMTDGTEKTQRGKWLSQTSAEPRKEQLRLFGRSSFSSASVTKMPHKLQRRTSVVRRNDGEYKHSLVEDIISYAIADLLGFHRAEGPGTWRRGRHAQPARVVTGAPCNFPLQAVTTVSIIITFVTLFLIAWAFEIEPIFESFPTQVTTVTRIGQIAGAVYTIIVLRDEIFGSSFDLGILVLFLLERGTAPADGLDGVPPSASVPVPRTLSSIASSSFESPRLRREWSGGSFFRAVLGRRSSSQGSSLSDLPVSSEAIVITRGMRLRRFFAVLLCSLRFLLGMLALWVSTLLICEADSIIELFRDFAAFTFVVELDRLLLLSVKAGMLGWDLTDYLDGLSLHTCFHLEPDPEGGAVPGARTSGWIVRMGSQRNLDGGLAATFERSGYSPSAGTGSASTTRASTRTSTSSLASDEALPKAGARAYSAEEKKRRIAVWVRCSSAVLVTTALLPAVFFLLIWGLQQSSHLACPAVHVNLDVGVGLASKFQGSYELDSWDASGYPHYRSTTGAPKNHLFYDSVNTGAWCLTDESSYNGGEDLSCQVWSQDTDTFNVVDAGNELRWTTVTAAGAEDAGVSMLCEVCSGSTPSERRNACSYRGTCKLAEGPFAGYFAWEDNRCECEPGTYGRLCQYVAPCDHFRTWGAANDYGGIAGTEFYALYLEDGARLLLHERQVYLSTDNAFMDQVDIAYYNPCHQAWMISSMNVSRFAGTTLEGGAMNLADQQACWTIQTALANCVEKSAFRSMTTNFLDPTLAPMAVVWEQYVGPRDIYESLPAMRVACKECLPPGDPGVIASASCSNGGVCATTDCGCPADFSGILSDGDGGTHLCVRGECADETRCECPTGYTGSLCDVPGAVISFSLVVKHEGVCHQTIVQRMDATRPCSPIFRRPLTVALNASEVAGSSPLVGRRRLSGLDLEGYDAKTMDVAGVDTHPYNILFMATPTRFVVLKEGSGEAYPLRSEHPSRISIDRSRCDAGNFSSILLETSREQHHVGRTGFMMRDGNIVLDAPLLTEDCPLFRPTSTTDFPEDLSLLWEDKALELAYLTLEYDVNVAEF